jgi:hypothetical protein
MTSGRNLWYVNRPHGSVSTTPASRSTPRWSERLVCLAPVSSTRWVVHNIS